MVILFCVYLRMKALQYTFRHPNTNIDPKQMRFLPVCLATLNFNDLRNISINKTMEQPAMLSKSIWFQKHIHF